MAKSRKRKSDFSLAEEPGEWDGIDPKEEKKKEKEVSRHDKPDYSIYRLAGQMSTTISLSLSIIGTDNLLSSFDVHVVEPSPSGNSFRVQVYSKDPELEYDSGEIKKMLKEAKPRFRKEIALEINRKKVPDFTFDVLPPHVFPH